MSRLQDSLRSIPQCKAANVKAIREHLAHKERDAEDARHSASQLRNCGRSSSREAERAALRIPTARGDGGIPGTMPPKQFPGRRSISSTAARSSGNMNFGGTR